MNSKSDFYDLFEIFDLVNEGMSISKAFHLCQQKKLDIKRNAFFNFCKNLKILTVIEKQVCQPEVLYEVAKELKIEYVYLGYCTYREEIGKNEL